MSGKAANKGKIHHLRGLKKLFTEYADEEPDASLSFAAFQTLYGNAVSNDPFLQNHSSEWVRRIHRSG
eukprot:8539185-Karenia_brevis.AAC.1